MHIYYRNTMTREIARATPGEWDTDEWSPVQTIAYLAALCVAAVIGIAAVLS